MVQLIFVDTLDSIIVLLLITGDSKFLNDCL